MFVPPFESKAVERSFTEHLDLLERERPRTKKTPLALITDQKLEYQRVLRQGGAWYGALSLPSRLCRQREPWYEAGGIIFVTLGRGNVRRARNG
jgi:hypothetical protein